MADLHSVTKTVNLAPFCIFSFGTGVTVINELNRSDYREIRKLNVISFSVDNDNVT